MSFDGQGCTASTDAQACIALLVWRGLAEEATAQHLPAPTRNKVLRALQGEQAETLCLLRDMLAGMVSSTSSRHAHPHPPDTPHPPDMLPNIESSQASRSGDGRSGSGRLGRRGEEVVLVGRSPTARLHLLLALCACVEALVTVTPCSVTAATCVLDTLPLLLARPSLVRLPSSRTAPGLWLNVGVAHSASLPPGSLCLPPACRALPPSRLWRSSCACLLSLYASIPLCLYPSLPLSLYASISLCLYLSMPLSLYASILYHSMPLSLYASISLCLYPSVPLSHYASDPLCLYPSVPLSHYASIPLCASTDASNILDSEKCNTGE